MRLPRALFYAFRPGPDPAASLVTKGLYGTSSSDRTVTPFRRRPPPSAAVSSVALDAPLLPPQAPELKGKHTLVLDLDETLVYARRSIVHQRPFLKEFLQFIEGKFEIVVWTAGTEQYGSYVLQRVGHGHVVHHRIFRDPRWFPKEALEEEDHLYKKQLELLHRDVSRVLVIENTPECCVEARMNSIMVPDYEVHSIADAQQSKDTSLRELIPILARFLSDSEKSVPEVIVQLHKEGILQENEFVSLTSGNLGRFYHIGHPTRSMPKGPLKKPKKLEDEAW